MAGGGIVVGSHMRQHPARLTPFVLIACIVAASGGLIFGYDIGISGGVTGMDPFLLKFFPGVYLRKQSATEDNYCKYDNHSLQFFTSSLYLAGLVASFVAATVSRKYGRITSIRVGGLSFLAGAILNGSAVNLAMLIIGRILLGIGVGFGNQSVPLYLSEMAPARMRGALNMMFQLAITIGILSANFVNYGAVKVEWGWRLSLGLAGVPAILMTIGGFTLPDTPNSLIERGYLVKGKHLLMKIRGVPNVDAEYDELVSASLKSKLVERPLRTILERRNRPQLIMATLIPFFQQLTGINAIMFYAPVLFQTLGFGTGASLYTAVITGVVNLVATFVSVATVDRFGRRKLFLTGGVQMLISQVLIGSILQALFGSVQQLAEGPSIIVVVFICTYVAAFAWSWGPLGWLVPSEIFPLETRSAGQAINVSTNMLFTFIVAQAFLTMLCHFQYGIFYFFGGWVLVMTIFIFFFLPETKGVQIEEMTAVWRAHWFWGWIVGQEDDLEAP